jgi:hypothetical protein
LNTAAATTEQTSDESPPPTPSLETPADDILNASRKRERTGRTGQKCSVQAPKKKEKCIETLSHRFVERKNFKDRHDEEIQKEKLDILSIEKEIKLKQLAILQQQMEYEQKLQQLNLRNRLKEMEREIKLHDIKV